MTPFVSQTRLMACIVFSDGSAEMAAIYVFLTLVAGAANHRTLLSQDQRY